MKCRLAHRCICTVEDVGFVFKDMLAWEKDKASYKAQKVSSVLIRHKDYVNSEKWRGWKVGNLRPLFETILWFIKPYPIGNTLTDNVLRYGVGAFNESVLKNNILINEGLEVCSNIIKVKAKKTDRGLHPTQKIVSLMEILIALTTIEGQIVLDPFCGSGTTLVAAKNLNRDYIGIEKQYEYVQKAIKRLDNME